MLEPSHSPTTIALKPQKERGAPLEVLFHFLLWTHERTRWVELQSLQRNNGFVWRIFHTNYVLSIRLFILQSRFISFCDVGSLAPISLRELIRGLIQLYIIIPFPSVRLEMDGFGSFFLFASMEWNGKFGELQTSSFKLWMSPCQRDTMDQLVIDH